MRIVIPTDLDVSRESHRDAAEIFPNGIPVNKLAINALIQSGFPVGALFRYFLPPAEAEFLMAGYMHSLAALEEANYVKALNQVEKIVAYAATTTSPALATASNFLRNHSWETPSTQDDLLMTMSSLFCAIYLRGRQ